MHWSAAPSGKGQEPGIRYQNEGGKPPSEDTHTTRFGQAGNREPGTTLAPGPRFLALRKPGGHSEGQNTRSHPELGRENPQRRWYCVSRRGRVGRRQAPPHTPSPTAGWSSPVARQAHNLKVRGSNPLPATTLSC